MRLSYCKLIVIFAVAVGARVTFTALNGDVPLVAEMKAYWDAAGGLLAGEGFHAGHGFRAFIPPAYAWFLAAVRFFGGTPLSARIAQGFLGGGTAVCLYLFASRNFGEKAATLAAFAFALWPPSLAIGDFLLTEALFTFLLWGALATWGDGSSWRRAALAGLLGGAAALARELALYFFPAIAVACVAARAPRTAARAALAAAVVCICVAPWTVRNWRVLGGVVPVTTKSNVDLFIYNHNSFRQILNNESDQPGEAALFTDAGSELELTRLARARTFAWIKGHPALFLFKGVRTEMNFLGLERDYFQHQLYGYFRPLPLPLNVALAPVFLLPSAAALMLGFVGFLRWRRLPGLRAGLSIAALYFIITFVAYSFTRQRYPLTPLIISLAAAAITDGRASWSWLKRRRRRWLTAAAFGSFLLSAWALEIWLDAGDYFRS